MMRMNNFIGGKAVGSAETIAVEDPATGAIFAEVARADTRTVDAAVAAARARFDAGTLWGMRPLARGDLLHAVAAGLITRREEIANVLCRESGINISGARSGVDEAASYFRYYGGLAAASRTRTISLGSDYADYVVPQPIGVSAQIVPWNFPLALAARGIAPALAVGCTVVVKAPELTPLALLMLAEICAEAGLPDGAVNVITGYGHDAGAHLAAHPDIDQITFTGSVQTGRAILRAAAETITPVTAELGGKSAGIVLADADIAQVVDSARWGMFWNAGQVCSGFARMLVHRSIHDRVVDAVADEVSKLTIGPGIDDCDLTPVISERQLDHVEAITKAGIAAGGRAVTGGSRIDRAGYFMAPTIIAEAPLDAPSMREEIFGPVLSIMPYDDLSDAIRIANDTPYGLVAGVFTADINAALSVADRLKGGQVFVNEWFAGGIETPFGGVGQSGYGREKGEEALLGYLAPKNIGIRIDHKAVPR
jgi:aldehyde dehydrogenase (NAD+)